MLDRLPGHLEKRGLCSPMAPSEVLSRGLVESVI